MKTSKKKAQDTATTNTCQIQVYIPPDLLTWLDEDCLTRQAEIQAELGSQRTLSRSAHVVGILHQFRLLKKASGQRSSRELWEAIHQAVSTKGKRAK